MAFRFVVITGKDPSGRSRFELSRHLAVRGVILQDKVDSSTNALFDLHGLNAKPTTKLIKARKLGVPVYGHRELNNLIANGAVDTVSDHPNPPSPEAPPQAINPRSKRCMDKLLCPVSDEAHLPSIGF